MTGSFTKLDGIRIARISTVPFYVVAQLKNQIAFLGKNGAEVTVIASNEPELAEFDGIENVACHPIDIPRAISPWRDLVAVLRMFYFFKCHGVQIVHSTTPKAGLLTAIAAFLAQVPVRLHTFTGQPWVTLYGIKRWLARSSDKLIGLLNTRCYTDSPSQRLFLIEQGIIRANQLLVIGSGSLAGVDTQRFNSSRFGAQECQALRRSLDIPLESPVLLFVGRITTDKGIQELLQAFHRLKTSDSAAHLVLVGHFDAESGVSSTVTPSDVAQIPDTHVVDYTPAPEVYMAMADILCLPSYREGFGTVVIEAASMGLPTVGTNIYGLSDAVIHNETGLLVPPRDVSALTNALEQLLSDSALRATMGHAARQRVYARFDADQFNRNVADAYVSLLHEAGITGVGRNS